MPRGPLVGVLLVGTILGVACSAPAPDGGNAADTVLDAEQREILASAGLPTGVNVGMIERGARIFLGYGNCHVCHAEDARGARGVGADLTDDEWWNSDGSWRGIVETIESGVPSEDSHNEWGAMMPVRGGTDIDGEEVRAVAAYVWALRLITPDPVP